MKRAGYILPTILDVSPECILCSVSDFVLVPFELRIVDVADVHCNIGNCSACSILAKTNGIFVILILPFGISEGRIPHGVNRPSGSTVAPVLNLYELTLESLFLILFPQVFSSVACEADFPIIWSAEKLLITCLWLMWKFVKWTYT